MDRAYRLLISIGLILIMGSFVSCNQNLTTVSTERTPQTTKSEPLVETAIPNPTIPPEPSVDPQIYIDQLRQIEHSEDISEYSQDVYVAEYYGHTADLTRTDCVDANAVESLKGIMHALDVYELLGNPHASYKYHLPPEVSAGESVYKAWFVLTDGTILEILFGTAMPWEVGRFGETLEQWEIDELSAERRARLDAIREKWTISEKPQIYWVYNKEVIKAELLIEQLKAGERYFGLSKYMIH